MNTFLFSLLLMTLMPFAFPWTAQAQGYDNSISSSETTAPKTTTAPRKPANVPSKSKCPQNDMKCLALEEQNKDAGLAPSYEERTGRKKK